MNEGVFANLLCAAIMVVALIATIGITVRTMLEERRADRSYKERRSDDD